MEDKESIVILTAMLGTYPFTREEEEAVRAAIGVLGWTKLIEGWKESKKKKRDRALSDDE